MKTERRPTKKLGEVIRALEICTNGVPNCMACPYATADGFPEGCVASVNDLDRDALFYLSAYAEERGCGYSEGRQV